MKNYNNRNERICVEFAFNAELNVQMHENIEVEDETATVLI